MCVGFDEGDWDRGWHSSEKYICAACLDDGFLAEMVAAAATDDDECSFCESCPAAEFDVLMEAFMVGVHNMFEQADDAGMPWEGGYVFETYDQGDVVDSVGVIATGDHELEIMEEIHSCMEEKTYASRWWIAVEPHEAFTDTWRDFREQIMHRTRFVFWARPDNSSDLAGAGEVPVANILASIGNLLLEFGLVTTFPAGTALYRARGHNLKTDSDDWAAADLGTNTPENSIYSTRMAPAGIPLFYGAGDSATALAEVAQADQREFFTVGQFVTTAPITAVDLTRVPAVPSIFDPDYGRFQGQLRFLNELVEEMRKPVDTVRSNLDYIPTQVFCEYMLKVFAGDTAGDVQFGGIAWASAAAIDGLCIALDIPQKDCVDTADPAETKPQLHLVSNGKSVHQRRTDEFRIV